MMTYQEIWLASLKNTKHGREDGLTPAEVFEYPSYAHSDGPVCDWTE